jgi:hypothetical protein
MRGRCVRCQTIGDAIAAALILCDGARGHIDRLGHCRDGTHVRLAFRHRMQSAVAIDERPHIRRHDNPVGAVHSEGLRIGRIGNLDFKDCREIGVRGKRMRVPDLVVPESYYYAVLVDAFEEGPGGIGVGIVECRDCIALQDKPGSDIAVLRVVKAYDFAAFAQSPTLCLGALNGQRNVGDVGVVFAVVALRVVVVGGIVIAAYEIPGRNDPARNTEQRRTGHRDDVYLPGPSPL